MEAISEHESANIESVAVGEAWSLLQCMVKVVAGVKSDSIQLSRLTKPLQRIKCIPAVNACVHACTTHH